MEKVKIIIKTTSKKKGTEKISLHWFIYEKGEYTTDNTEIQRVIRDYFEKPYDTKQEKLEEMNKFLDWLL